MIDIINETIELNPKQEVITLKQIFEDEEIQKILGIKDEDGEEIPKRKKGDPQILTQEKLKEFEEKIEEKFLNKDLSLFNLEDKEDLKIFLTTLQKIIETHPDYIQGEDKITVDSKDMDNIYINFPRLLLVIYFKNKTGVDFRELNKIPSLKEEKKENFIDIVKKISKNLKEIKTEKNNSLELSIERFRNTLSEIIFFKEKIEGI